MFNWLLGLEGSRYEGLEELQRAATAGNTDAKFILKSVLVRERRLVEALALLKELSESYSRNISFRIQMAQVLAKLGRENEARKVFQEVLSRVRSDKTIDPRYTPSKIEVLARQANVGIP